MMKKMTTLLLSLLVLTHTSNIQADDDGIYEGLQTAVANAIKHVAKKAVDRYTNGKLTDLQNCANNNFSGDVCQDYLNTICTDIKNSSQYTQLKSDIDDWGKDYCKDAFTTAQGQNKYVGLCNFEEDLCSLT